ncbi:MAG: DUF5615 family PIN-like protein [Pyrinomonadaceae bacterium]
MKLLLDQNISRKLVNQLDDVFLETTHISTSLSEQSEDVEIWNFAEDNGYVIVTKDDDFEKAKHPIRTSAENTLAKTWQL